MGALPRLVWQPSLLDSSAPPAIDESFAALERTYLDPSAWFDLAPAWVSSSDALFAALLEEAAWDQRRRHLYDRTVLEPRLTAMWRAEDGGTLRPPLLQRMLAVLSERYDVAFDSVGLNLYRDGADSVAWHGDRIAEDIVDPIVALVSVGEPRAFLLRPKGGGTARRLRLGRGDLLVMGGTSQRTWEHSVPKVARAGPRISIAFRHGLRLAAYVRQQGPEGAAERPPSPTS
jgi:alkylated DNA repair dioxygenase AlkB